ncbi:hypothetical protein O181_058494 [Austropuccinia psidii MF-1]|uniref:Uncharacterized protein n=1 Tax=Austropuccinia psidii MF-1 TaxID=1389203 RepID=A0A9Q3ECJ4_9BASI|nr:hypothetical protein [Austropuccinia psidii MF-1]
MLGRLHTPPDETPTLPPISALTTPYSSAPTPHLLLGLQSLNCCRTLKLFLRRRPHPPLCLLAPTQHASDAAYHPYACSARPTCLQHCLPSLCSQCPPEMPQMLLTILMLVEFLPKIPPTGLTILMLV